MELYNKGSRGFIVKREDAISGCRLPTDEIGKTKAYIDPGKTVEVTEECGERLLKMYPVELISIGKQSREARVQKALNEVEKTKKTKRSSKKKDTKEPEDKKKRSKR